MTISCKLSFCLGFANIDSQTNKLMSVLILHCTVNTLQYVPYIGELSKPENILWHKNRLVMSSTLSELAFIYMTFLFIYSFRDSPRKYILTYISISFLWLCLADLSLLKIHDLQKKVPDNKFLLFNKQKNFLLVYRSVLEDVFIHHY